jgi:hypothetical protein
MDILYAPCLKIDPGKSFQNIRLSKQPMLAKCYAASIRYLSALGINSGKPLLRLISPELIKTDVFEEGTCFGFNLHASPAIRPMMAEDLNVFYATWVALLISPSYDEIESLLLENLESKLKKFRTEDNDPINAIDLFHTYKLIVEGGFSYIQKEISSKLTQYLGIKESMFMDDKLDKMTVCGSFSSSERTFALPIKTKSSRYARENAFDTKLEQWFKANASDSRRHL